MLSESHPRVRMLLRFAMLPACFLTTVDWDECRRTRFQVALDFLHIFFRLRYYPDNYGPCRLWETPREEWVYYFGSSYHPWARHHLRKAVQPYDAVALFVDKVRCDAHFRQAGIPMPRPLGILDSDSDVTQVLESCLRAGEGRPVIVKPVFGAKGRDVSIAERRDGVLVLRNGAGVKPVDVLRVTEPYLVQEYVEQHADVARIFSGSVNTIRVVVLLTASGSPLTLGAYIRLGRGTSIVDNVNQGGVAVPIDLTRATLGEHGFDSRGRRHRFHPDTKIAFGGVQIPNWDAVMDLARRAQLAVPFYKLIGLDVAVTPLGAVVIEVNANPDIVGLEQKCGPLLKNSRVLAEFHRHGLLFNRHQRELMRGQA